MANLLGKRIKRVSFLGLHDIQWPHYKQTACSHIEVLKYNVYKYRVDDTEEVVPVFVHCDSLIDSHRWVSKEFQYGDLTGKPFLVLHNKRLYHPPQHSFINIKALDLAIPEGRQAKSCFGFGSGRYGQMDPLKDFDKDVEPDPL